MSSNASASEDKTRMLHHKSPYPAAGPPPSSSAFVTDPFLYSYQSARKLQRRSVPRHRQTDSADPHPLHHNLPRSEKSSSARIHKPGESRYQDSSASDSLVDGKILRPAKSSEEVVLLSKQKENHKQRQRRSLEEPIASSSRRGSLLASSSFEALPRPRSVDQARTECDNPSPLSTEDVQRRSRRLSEVSGTTETARGETFESDNRRRGSDSRARGPPRLPLRSPLHRRDGSDNDTNGDADMASSAVLSYLPPSASPRTAWQHHHSNRHPQAWTVVIDQVSGQQKAKMPQTRQLYLSPSQMFSPPAIADLPLGFFANGNHATGNGNDGTAIAANGTQQGQDHATSSTAAYSAIPIPSSRPCPYDANNVPIALPPILTLEEIQGSLDGLADHYPYMNEFMQPTYTYPDSIPADMGMGMTAAKVEEQDPLPLQSRPSTGTLEAPAYTTGVPQYAAQQSVEPQYFADAIPGPDNGPAIAAPAQYPPNTAFIATAGRSAPESAHSVSNNTSPPPRTSFSDEGRPTSADGVPSERSQSPGSSRQRMGTPPKRAGKLPMHVTNILKAWLMAHTTHPYPTEDEKRGLCGETGLSLIQVSNWFINARRRILPSLGGHPSLTIPPPSHPGRRAARHDGHPPAPAQPSLIQPVHPEAAMVPHHPYAYGYYPYPPHPHDPALASHYRPHPYQYRPIPAYSGTGYRQNAPPNRER